MEQPPSDYVRDWQRKRKSQLFTGVVMFLGFGASTVLKAGAWFAWVLVGLVLLYVVFVMWGRRRSHRGLAASGGSFVAQLPVWVARHHGAEVAAKVPDTRQYFGRLTISGNEIRWLPGKSATRAGLTPLRWPLEQGTHTSVAPLWGPIPMSLLRLAGESGRDDVLVRREAGVVREEIALTSHDGSTAGQ